MIANMKVFDCTIREMGYQTGWNFDKKVVQKVYRFAEDRGVDYLELGFFHNFDADPNRGIFRYCGSKKEEVRDAFSYVKNRVKLSAMRDIQRPLGEVPPQKEGIVDTIRILTRSHETDIDVLKRHVDEATNLGYEVYINFTSAGNNTPDITSKFAEVAKSLGLSTVYFADTESIMTPKYIKDTIAICKDVGINVGMHLHDKNGEAEQLADLSISHGVNAIDVCHLGLGGKWRDGNLTLEYLMKKFGIPLGYENTSLRNDLIEQLIKYNSESTAE